LRLAETVMVGRVAPPDDEGVCVGAVAAGASPAAAGWSCGGSGVCAHAPTLSDEIKNEIDANGRGRNNTDTPRARREMKPENALSA